MYIKAEGQNEVKASEITKGLRFLGDLESPNLVNNYMTATGQDGNIWNSTDYQMTTDNANFWLKFNNWYDMKLAIHDIRKVFSQKGLLRIRTNAEPAIVKFVRAGNFDIQPVADGVNASKFTIPFDNPSGYKYSLANSDVAKTYEQEAWQLGMNLPNGQDLRYNFVNQSQFRVYNASDITVDPYMQRHELKIIIKHSGGAFGIENKTTSDLYRFNGNMDSNGTLMIDGINTYKNNALADNQTNYSYLTLAAGWNDIRIIGATDLDITFSFPFIYLG